MKTVILFILLLVFVSCSNKHNNATNNPTSKLSEFSFTKKAVKDTLYRKSKFNLYSSDIYFEVEITKIEMKEKKNYYVIKKYQYAVPDTVLLSDFSPVISFKITNTNDKEFTAPIPDSYELVDRYLFRSYRPYLYLDESGRRVNFRSHGVEALNCKPIYIKSMKRMTYFNFKPYEAKEFKVRFDPVPPSIDIVNFTGFHTEYHPPKGTENYYNIQEVWFLIDLKKKKVIGKNFPFER